MLSEYYLTIEDFQDCAKICAQDLSQWVGINHIQRHRMSDLAQDIVSFSENLVRAHINATMWVLDDVQEVSQHISSNPPQWEDLHVFLSGEHTLEPHVEDAVKKHIDEGSKHLERMLKRSKSRAGQRSEEATWELKACYKAYFFFIRAFHDACYGVLLNINGSTPGAYSSMNKCVTKQVTPMFKQINDIPGYVDWFISFKTKRDLIKLGTNFSLCGPQWDVGVGFNRITPEGGVVSDASENGNKFRLGDLINAIKYSTAVIKLISQITTRSNKSLNLTGAENALSS